MLEQSIQLKIRKYAESIGFIVVKTIKLSDSGYPDLFMFKAGKTLFIEVKKPKEELSALQELRQKILRREGFICEKCESVDQFKTIISNHLK